MPRHAHRPSPTSRHFRSQVIRGGTVVAGVHAAQRRNGHRTHGVSGAPAFRLKPRTHPLQPDFRKMSHKTGFFMASKPPHRSVLHLKSAAVDGRYWTSTDIRNPSRCALAERSGTGRSAKTTESADKPGSVVDNHSSRPRVAAWLEQPTRGRRGPRHGPPIRSCSRWGLPCRSVARLAVRSYRTVSPLPDPLARPSAVCSLLHFPSARAAQALPGTLPCGARTFLGVLADDAVAWPTPPASLAAT